MLAMAVLVPGGLMALCAVALVLLLARTERGRRWLQPLVGLGDASYAVYLCHMPAVALVAHTLGVHPAGLFVPAAVVVSIAVGVGFHLVVEKPLIAASRKAPIRFGRSASPSPRGEGSGVGGSPRHARELRHGRIEEPRCACGSPPPLAPPLKGEGNGAPGAREE